VNIYRVSRIRIPRDRRKACYATPYVVAATSADKALRAVGDYETLPLYDIEVWQVSEYDLHEGAIILRGNSYPVARDYGNEFLSGERPYYERFGREAFRLVPAKEEVTK